MNKKEIAVVASCNTKFVPHLAALFVSERCGESACTRESVHQKYDGRERDFANETRLAAD